MNEWILLVWVMLPVECPDEGYCQVEYEPVKRFAPESLEACRVREGQVGDQLEAAGKIYIARCAPQ